MPAMTGLNRLINEGTRIGRSRLGGNYYRPLDINSPHLEIRQRPNTEQERERRIRQDYNRVMEALADMNRRIRQLERQMASKDARIAELENQVASFHQALEAWTDQPE